MKGIQKIKTQLINRILVTNNESLPDAVDVIFATVQPLEILSLSEEQIEMLKMSEFDIAPSGARLRRVPTKINSPIVVFATRFVTKIVFYERDYVNSSYRNYEEDNSVFCNVNVEPLWSCILKNRVVNALFSLYK